MTMLRAEFGVEEEILQQSISESRLLDEKLLQDRGQMMISRDADASTFNNGGAARRRAEALNADNQGQDHGHDPRTASHIDAPETGDLEAAAVRGGPEAQVDSRLCQPQGAL